MRNVGAVSLLLASALTLGACAGQSAETAEFCERADELWAAIEDFDTKATDNYDLDHWGMSQKEQAGFELAPYEGDLDDLDVEAVLNLVPNARDLFHHLAELGKVVPREGKKIWEEAKFTVETMAELTEWTDDLLQDKPSHSTPPPNVDTRELSRLTQTDTAGMIRSVIDFYKYIARTCPRS